MRNINPFGLRLQPDLKARLEEAAKENKRSLNAEISARLEASFDAWADRPVYAAMESEVPPYGDGVITQAIIRAFQAIEGKTASEALAELEKNLDKPPKK